MLMEEAGTIMNAKTIFMTNYKPLLVAYTQMQSAGK